MTIGYPIGCAIILLPAFGYNTCTIRAYEMKGVFVVKWKLPVALVMLGLVGGGMAPVWQDDRESLIQQPLSVVHAGPVQIARNKPAPAFDLQGLDGKAYHVVGGEREKPLIINFWASWCGPCHEEAPDLERMYDTYKGELDIYAVNVTKGDRIEDVRGFVKQYGLSFPVLLDQKGSTAESYRLLFVPTSFLVNKQGVLVDVIHVLPPAELESKIKLLLNKD
jgi:thiol-disulfide isomerase/thioredoxin